MNRWCAQLLFSMILPLVGCATDMPRQRVFDQEGMIGTWYGNQPQSGYAFTEWKAHRSGDGSTEIHFRFGNDCRNVETQDETGQWRLIGDQYSSETVIRGDDEPLYGQYLILSLTKRKMTYRHLASGTVFSVKRVPADYPWRECVGE